MIKRFCTFELTALFWVRNPLTLLLMKNLKPRAWNSIEAFTKVFASYYVSLLWACIKICTSKDCKYLFLIQTLTIFILTSIFVLCVCVNLGIYTTQNLLRISFSTVCYFCVFVINMKIDLKELNIISASLKWRSDNLSTQ